MRTPMRTADLLALREKYERILVLRLRHARTHSERGFVEPSPKQAMRELAHQFPGALRELDGLPLDVVRNRLAALTAAVEADELASTAPWMRAQVLFHRLARGALTVKRWLRGRPVGPDTHEHFAREGFANEAQLWADDLHTVSAPPRGRLTNVVFARLGRELGTTETEARAAVLEPLGSSRRGRP